EVDPAVEFVAKLQRRGAVFRLQHPITQLLQTFTHVGANQGLILDHQQELSGDTSARFRSRERWLDGSLGRRKVQLESRPMPRFAIHPDVAAALLDDA